LSDRAFQFEHRVAAHAVLARILWIQGFPDQAMRAGHDSIECAESIGHSLSLRHALSSACCVATWTGDMLGAKRLVARLLCHSNRHAPSFWQFWERCLEFALTQRGGKTRVRHPLLSDPLCSPMHQETLGTLNEGLLTDEAVARAENGLAGWCAAELLRVKAEILLREDGANTAVSEAMFQQSLDIAREQDALSWELRTAMSLARLRHEQGRTREAHGLLASVHARFTEGFETTDLRRAKALLDAMTVIRREVAAPVTVIVRRRAPPIPAAARINEAERPDDREHDKAAPGLA
jgi:hypothetical protein